MKKKRREKEDTTWTGCLEIHGGLGPETSNLGKELVVPSSSLDNLTAQRRIFQTAGNHGGRTSERPFQRKQKPCKNKIKRGVSKTFCRQVWSPLTSRGSNCAFGRKCHSSCAGCEPLAAELYQVQKDASCTSFSMFNKILPKKYSTVRSQVVMSSWSKQSSAISPVVLNA
jgi:hypothetical protein